MTTKKLTTLVALSALLLAGCTAGSQGPPEPRSAAATPHTSDTGPGLWPSGQPAPPSPSAAPGTDETLGHAVQSSTDVSTSTSPGWRTYQSINDIQDLAFAPDGTLWAATNGGLVHWDLETQTYTRYEIKARAMALGLDGTLWLALEQGLCHFDGASCETHTGANGPIGSDVQAVAVTGDGAVWVGSGQGVSRFDGDSWKRYPSPVATHDLAVTKSGKVWAATAGGIGRYLPGEDAWTTYTEEDGLPSSSAQVIAAEPDGDVWAYLVWEGVYRFDGTAWQKVEGAGNSVFDMAFAADGTPWVATTGGMHYPGGSLSYRDGEQWIDAASGEALHSFTAVALGPGGIVAASTQMGLGLWEEGEWRLLRDGPTSDRVTSVAVTADGAAWFAFGDHSVSTPGGGVSRFDGQEWDYYLDDGEVNALAADPDGRLWAGNGCAVQRFDGATWETVATCDDLPTGEVMDIALAADGTVWVAKSFGLARFDGEAWSVYERLPNSLVVAPDGTIWMKGWEGTQGSFYIACFDGEAWTTFQAADSFPGGFSVQAATSDGLLWGTTPEGKLASFDGRSWMEGESWTLYEPPGRPSEEHLAVLAEAPDGALWVATSGAFVRFDRERAPGEAWAVYTKEDGLPDSYSQAIAFGPGEAVWFGATRFQPAQAEGSVEGATEPGSPESHDCSLANAFPPEEAELVWPTLHQVQPARAAPGDEVEIRGTGGFLYWNNECGEFRNESARDFQLFFDGEPVGSITCYAHTCLVDLTVPADAPPGAHTISVEGGSSLEVEISHATGL